MAVVQLATVKDVGEALGRELTDEEAKRVKPVLDKASELFRREAGQQFTAGTSTVRLKVNGGRVHLPQSPVTDVLSVMGDGGHPVTHELQGQWLSVPLGSAKFVTVTYSHGGDVPDLVRLAVADIARKVLSIDKRAVSGQTQYSQTTGPFSESSTYAVWAVGGQTMLAPDDRALARSFRVRVPTVWVMQP